MQRMVIASVVLLSVIGSSLAIRCYQCTTGDANCANPVSSMDTQCDASDPNKNTCFKTSAAIQGGTFAIARGCGRAPQGSEGLGLNDCKDIDVGTSKTTVCQCNSKDLCNSAGSFKISMTATGISVFLAMILTKFL